MLVVGKDQERRGYLLDLDRAALELEQRKKRQRPAQTYAQSSSAAPRRTSQYHI